MTEDLMLAMEEASEATNRFRVLRAAKLRAESTRKGARSDHCGRLSLRQSGTLAASAGRAFFASRAGGHLTL
jgi:hypothetical protein